MPTTRRGQIDKLLQDSELLAEIFNSTCDGILVVGEDGIIAYTNPAAEELLGISHDALIGVKATELPLSMHFIEGKEMPARSRPFANGINSKTIKGPIQVILKRLDGSTLPVIFNVHKKGKGLTVAVLTDNSVMMRNQQQADEYYRFLAHDMRTPLTVIVGHAEILQSRLQEDPSIKAILDAGKQLESLTKEMGDRLELESKHFRLIKEEIHLKAIVEEVASQLSSNMTKHKFEIESHVTSTVFADAYRLKRVLINLLTNAMKYSPENTIISIFLWENKQGVMIKVSDQGRGIEAEDLNYIFDPFFISSLGKKKGGIGLGLHIARLIMEAHNGHIYVSSTENGTSFVLSLPKT